MPDYEKKASGVFNKLQDRLDTALINAKRVEDAAKKDGSINPSTKVGALITDLINIRDDFENEK